MLLSDILCKLDYENIINSNVASLSAASVSDVCSDSRKARENTVFVCISGAVHDGHDYALAAYNQNCRIFVCQRVVDLPSDAALILVKDTRKALAQLSAAFFKDPANELTVIGGTGTKGKTTTSILIYKTLNASGIKTGYIGSNGVDYCDLHFDTANTTPESYELHRYMRQMADAGVKVLVIEVSSQALMLSRVYGIKFDICVFTNLSPDHIGGNEHPTFDNYKACKHSLFTDYGASLVVYNADDPHANDIVNGCDCKAISVSLAHDADYSASDVTYFRANDVLGVSFDCCNKVDGRKTLISLPFPGNFSVSNALLAIAVCQSFGLTCEDVGRVIENARVKGRFETLECPNGALVVIDYAHNGTSLAAAISVLRDYDPHRLICVFGSVGGRTKMRRADLAKAAQRSDECIITSDNPNHEPPIDIINDIASYFPKNGCPYSMVEDRKAAIEHALELSGYGDIILLAGKGHESYQLIKGVKEPFSETEIVTEYIEKMPV